jgi:hypothetical protein
MLESYPTVVRQRDGAVVPFQLDKLARSLFAATEAAGSPDPFLARELADGVVHFLTRETGEQPPTAELIAEVAAKVVRELGHPVLARCYDDRVHRLRTEGPLGTRHSGTAADNGVFSNRDPFDVLESAARKTLTDYSLAQVYPRDLASAHRDGLLRLLDLDWPQEMLGAVLSPNQPPPLDGWELLESLVAFRATAGSFVAIDGPEHAISIREGIPEEMAGGFLTALDRCLKITHLHGILNLNAAEPPAWARPVHAGLFQEFQREMQDERLDRIALYLLRHAKHQTVLWHIGERDLRDESNSRLREVIGRAISRDNVEFVFDRPRPPIVLGPGVDRRSPAALGLVGIDLPRLVLHLGGGRIDPEIFLTKLATLARFAKSAGYARQEHLRKYGRAALREGFLLERAVEIVMPLEVWEASQLVLETSDPDKIAGFAGRVVEAIVRTLGSDRSGSLTARIDSNTSASAISSSAAPESNLLPHQQIRYGSARHGCGDGGCLTIFLNQNDAMGVNELPDLIRTAWRGDIARLRIVWAGNARV